MQIITVDEKLFHFIKDCWENQYSLEILMFLGKHPSTRFNRKAILQSARWDMESSLHLLVKKGLVELHDDNGNTLYSLTSREPLHNTVLSMVKMDRRELQLALKKLSRPPEPIATPLPAIS